MKKQKKAPKVSNVVFITENIIKDATPENKPYFIKDITPGLYLKVNPSGTKVWVFRMRFKERPRHQVKIGSYTCGLSIDQAREAAVQIAGFISHGTRVKAKTMLTLDDFRILNPSGLPPACTFSELYSDWYGRIASKKFSPRYLGRVDNQIKNHVLPEIGNMDVDSINPFILNGALNKMRNAGKIETAHRLLSLCDRIFRYGISIGRTETNPAESLRGSLPSVKSRNMPSINASDSLKIGELIYKARHKEGVQYLMLLMQAYTFVRRTELRLAEWSEIDMDSKMWRIPANKMKNGKAHLVPLSDQAIAILKKMQIKGDKGNIFLSEMYKKKVKPVNENAVLIAIKSLGFQTGEMSTHGFRSIASTILNESGKFKSDAIERQLSHVPGNKVRASYNYAEYIEERKTMMQWYANKLDGFESAYAKSLAAKQGLRIAGPADDEKALQEGTIQYLNNSNKIHDIEDKTVDLHRVSYM